MQALLEMLPRLFASAPNLEVLVMERNGKALQRFTISSLYDIGNRILGTKKGSEDCKIVFDRLKYDVTSDNGRLAFQDIGAKGEGEGLALEIISFECRCQKIGGQHLLESDSSTSPPSSLVDDVVPESRSFLPPLHSMSSGYVCSVGCFSISIHFDPVNASEFHRFCSWHATVHAVAPTSMRCSGLENEEGIANRWNMRLSFPMHANGFSDSWDVG
ncbi:hypothetical protein VNO77_19801 [Canavalia gladiata]|uniref:Uncharacterized protein n=1 Tax=Canavalia gladiata TaxID=3824 RepID=A0AAN9LN69_CANGL